MSLKKIITGTPTAWLDVMGRRVQVGDHLRSRDGRNYRVDNDGRLVDVVDRFAPDVDVAQLEITWGERIMSGVRQLVPVRRRPIVRRK